MKMLGRVLVLRAVAAAYVATVQTHPQVNPGVAGLQALFTALCVWADIANRIEMGTFVRHSVLRVQSGSVHLPNES